MKRNLPIMLIATLFCSMACFLFIKARSLYNPQIVMTEMGHQIAVGDNTLVNNSKIQVALLLDTSGSMSGLLEQAKSQLWNIVSQLSDAQKQGQEVDLEIALYEYGNPSKSSRSDEINQLSGFTSDMDFISQKLFELTTNGGEEYCGAVIKTSLDDLQWGNQGSLKMIYIAGNEGFHQGPINYDEACKKAMANGVVVNTIFCGNAQNGFNLNWKKGADLGGGEYMNIDHNERTVYVETPYDDEINSLNSELNKTYIPFGQQGKQKFQNQSVQDANASSFSKANVSSRAKFKASKKYKAESWDLVDAYRKDKTILHNAKLTNAEHQNLTIAELEQLIDKASKEREHIKKNINELDQKRQQFITKEKTKNATNNKKDLESSILKSVKKHAEQKGFEFKKAE